MSTPLQAVGKLPAAPESLEAALQEVANPIRECNAGTSLMPWQVGPC